jgi:hypothetical protein
MTIEAISCYPNNAYSTVESLGYTITLTPSAGSPAVLVSGGGGGGSYSSGGSSGGSSVKVGIADFVLLMANWGQTGAGNPADFDNDSAVIGIQDFVWLMSHWTN